MDGKFDFFIYSQAAIVDGRRICETVARDRSSILKDVCAFVLDSRNNKSCVHYSGEKLNIFRNQWDIQ